MYCSKTFISDVKNLVKNCPNLKELDLSDCTVLTSASIEYIVEGLPKIEYLALSRCYSIPPTSYL